MDNTSILEQNKTQICGNHCGSCVFYNLYTSSHSKNNAIQKFESNV